MVSREGDVRRSVRGVERKNKSNMREVSWRGRDG